MTSLAEFDALGKRYGEHTVVDDLSLTVPEGAVIGLLGPNGAGKTTSIKVLLGLARATSGRVALLGQAPASSGFPAALRQVGSLIEGPALFARATARENLAIEAAARGVAKPAGRIDELLEIVGLAHRASSAAGSFSLGMRQRLGLAVALIAAPRLVVLDEPTNGLDPAGIVEIRELIRELPARGTTVLVSSHLLGEVQLMCDRAAILHRGRLLAEGSIAELLSAHGSHGFCVAVARGTSRRAASVLAEAGLEARVDDERRLTVDGPLPDGSAISRPLARVGIHLTELVPLSPSLEQVFLELTGDHARAAVPALEGVA